MKSTMPSHATVITTVFALSLGIWGLLPNEAKAQLGKKAIEAAKFEVDPFWPKPLPDRWVITDVGGVCVDAQDHVFSVNRGTLGPLEKKTATAAPPVTEFDPEGNLVNSWGDRNLLPKRLHGCFIDYEGNVWIGGNEDGIVQKYSHDGSKMLLQIGTKGKFDTSDGTMGGFSGGTITGPSMNSSHTLLNLPASIAVDATNGDVYIADGYGNRRVVVFDREGRFLRQWGRQVTLAEVEAGVGGVFFEVVHCVVIGKDGLVYVSDREGHRIEVFDKMGNFQRNILVEDKTGRLRGEGLVCWISFSPDPLQKLLYVGGCGTGEIRVLDRATGQALSSFGRPGTQVGENGSVHTIAVDSKSNIYVGDSPNRRVQKFRFVR